MVVTAAQSLIRLATIGLGGRKGGGHKGCSALIIINAAIQEECTSGVEFVRVTSVRITIAVGR